MRAAVLRAGRMVVREDVPEPVPGPGQVLVAVRACGICGSDLHFAEHGAELLELGGDVRDLALSPNLVDLDRDVFMGHEFAAEVLEAGPDTDAPAPGTLVTSQPILISPNRVDLLVYNNTVVGGYAERMLLSAPLLLTVPNGLDARYAALTEPLAVGLRAVTKSGVTAKDTALVIGCGPVGIAVVAALRSTGVEQIVAADFSPVRRELAQRIGATATVDPANGSPFDTVRPKAVFEAVGRPGILDEIVRMAPGGTRVVSVGMSMQPETLRPVVAAMKGITITFVFGQSPAEFAATLRSLAEGEIDVAPMVTGEVGLDGIQQAFDSLADPERHCKILVTP